MQPKHSQARASAHLELHGQGDADGAAAVGHAKLEGVDVARLVLARQPLVIVQAVAGDVLRVRLAQLLHRLIDDLHAPRLAHAVGVLRV